MSPREVVPMPTLGAFLEACAAHRTDSVEEIALFAGFSTSTGRKALPILRAFGLIGTDEDGCFVVTADGVRRGMDPGARDQVIRRGLLGFRPFELLVEGISYGESVEDAIRKAALILGISQSDAEDLTLLIRMGVDLGVLDQSNGRVTLVAELSQPMAEEMGLLSPEDVESEAKARLYNARRLGRDANNRLDEIDRTLLADALLQYESDPRTSVNASGQTLEDFLREVADERGLGTEAKKQSGAGQLANLLHKEGVIHSHHQKLIDAPGTIRNASSHRKDRKTLTPWEITPDGAFAALAMTLTAIRSIHHYVKNGRQTI